LVKLDKVEIIGAGPAGLYAAILLRRCMPGTLVRVSEQNPADATFGFGVVFSDQALDFLQADDPETHALITPLMERWHNMTLSLSGERIVLDGIGFSAIGRLQLLHLLQRRATEVGVEMRFDHELKSIDEIARDADLLIGADGLNSLVRRSDESRFDPQQKHFGNHFAWFGTPRSFETLTQTFVHGEKGVLNAHHYRYAPRMSTFIVECDAESFAAHGFGQMDEQESAQTCAGLFAETLEAAPLLVNRSTWRRFPGLWCDNWVAGNKVILGDAAHTAHFSIGSGTRLAFEDAIALVEALRQGDDCETALLDFQRQRQPVARKIVDAANTSARWYDGFRQHMSLPPIEFAYDYLTRSGRLQLEDLRRLSPRFIDQYENYRKQL
jgi:2-polyprenyl-6-methoxyphenol hydroxylase-like FAD-dependent oxidoreductase